LGTPDTGSLGGGASDKLLIGPNKTVTFTAEDVNLFNAFELRGWSGSVAIFEGGRFNWNGGRIRGQGAARMTVEIRPNTTVNLAREGMGMISLENANLTNRGLITWWRNLIRVDESEIVNRGRFDVRTDNEIRGVGANQEIKNYGEFRKRSSGTTRLRLKFSNG